MINESHRAEPSTLREHLDIEMQWKPLDFSHTYLQRKGVSVVQYHRFIFEARVASGLVMEKGLYERLKWHLSGST